jgi:NADPH:quinone reductase-like Zn-dependent oxidoreductase
MGLYGHHASLSQSKTLVPCSDICGTITNPNKSSKWKFGQRVMAIFNQTHLAGQIKEHNMSSGLGLPLPGVLCEYRCFPEESLVAVPDYLSDEEASCLPIASVTAWMAINGFRSLGSPANAIGGKESVLIQGTGGVAIAGLQIAHAAGFKTIVTSSSDLKLTKAKEMGSDATINYKSNADWETAVLDATDGQGADIIFENGGARTLRKSFDCVAFGGLINCIGYLSGKEDEPGDRLNTNVLALKRNVTLKGLLNGPKDRFEEMTEFYASKKIKPVVDRMFAFGEAKEALQYLFAGGHFGKVVVKVG